MSRLSVASKRPAPLAQIAENLRNAISKRGADFASADHAKGVASLEALDEQSLAAIRDQGARIRGELQTMFADAFGKNQDGKSISFESLIPQQLEAGEMVALASAAPREFHIAAQTMKASVSTENLRVVEPMTFGIHGDAGYMNRTATLEAFDERELKNYMPYSIAFNVGAARQDEFGDAFYQPVVISPDQAGFDVSIRRGMVMNEIRHSATGKAMDFNRKNLVDAYVDSSILATDSTVIIPVRLTSGADQAANNANFMLSPAVADRVTADGVTVVTAPLKPGVNIDLLGLGQRTDLATQGVYDVTDSLDVRLFLEKLYISITGATATSPATSTFAFDVSKLPRNAFLKSTEGQDREAYLQFITVDLPISATTEDMTGAAGAATSLEYLAGVGRTTWIVRLGITVNGDANYETGNVRANGTAVTIEGGYDTATGLALTQVEIDALKVEFATMSLVGYDVYAARTNLNRRTRGMQVTSNEITERYTIPLLSPISALSPNSSNRDASDLATLITAARIRNSNLAVTQLLNYNDMLASYALSQDRKLPVPAIEGIGRLLVRPYQKTVQLDARNVTASIKSQDRAADVSAAIINAIRAEVYNMYTLSGYQPAADALAGTAGEKPLVIIGTDPVTARHININGDTRTLGFHFESKIVTSMDERVRGKIFVTFVRPNSGGADPLSFGVMAWMPELAGTIQLTRNGATNKETMVQPRVRHINLLPLLIEIQVSNLTEAVSDTLPIRMDTIGTSGAVENP